MMAKTFSFSTISRHTCTALVGLYWSSRKTTWTLRPCTPPLAARNFQYRSLLSWKALLGKGAAPVTGAWIPILMVVSVTPVRSGSPSTASRGGGGAGGGPLGSGGGAGDGAGGPKTGAAWAAWAAGGLDGAVSPLEATSGDREPAALDWVGAGGAGTGRPPERR